MTHKDDMPKNFDPIDQAIQSIWGCGVESRHARKFGRYGSISRRLAEADMVARGRTPLTWRSMLKSLPSIQQE